jgi:propanediol dehydratase large subunit
MEESSSCIIVNKVVALLNSERETDLTIINKVVNEFKIDENEAESVLELTKTGLFRAQFISSGQIYPKNNLQDNPVLKAALKIGLEKLGKLELYENLYPKRRPWWKIW